MRNDEKTLIKGMLNGNRVSLSKLISVVESDPSAISRIIESIKEIPNKVCVIGITGPPVSLIHISEPTRPLYIS